MSFSVRGPVHSGAGLRASQSAFELGVSRLSSGLRIQRAADDVAGLAISERMRAQATGAAVATRNVHDGINLLQTADGGLASITSMLQRARELAVQALSTGATTQADRDAAAAEIRQLVAEVDRTARTTSFNGHRMLDGSRPAGYALQVGAFGGDALTASAYDVTAGTLQLQGASGVTSASASTSSTYETASRNINSGSAFTMTSDSNTFDFSLDGGQVTSVTLAPRTYTTIQVTELRDDLNAALGAQQVPVSVTLDGNGKRLLFHPAGGPSVRLDVTGSGGSALAITTTAAATTLSATVAALATDDLADLVATGSADALARCDAALDTVLSARSDVGALQNRLEHRLGVLAASELNLTTARSRIADADIAQEWAGVVRAQVLSQAGLAMQSQASAGGQRVLQLLGAR